MILGSQFRCFFHFLFLLQCDCSWLGQSGEWRVRWLGGVIAAAVAEPRQDCRLEGGSIAATTQPRKGQAISFEILSSKHISRSGREWRQSLPRFVKVQQTTLCDACSKFCLCSPTTPRKRLFCWGAWVRRWMSTTPLYIQVAPMVNVASGDHNPHLRYLRSYMINVRDRETWQAAHLEPCQITSTCLEILLKRYLYLKQTFFFRLSEKVAQTPRKYILKTENLFLSKKRTCFQTGYQYLTPTKQKGKEIVKNQSWRTQEEAEAKKAIFFSHSGTLDLADKQPWCSFLPLLLLLF